MSGWRRMSEYDFEKHGHVLLLFLGGWMTVACREHTEWWGFCGFPDSERLWSQNPVRWMPLPDYNGIEEAVRGVSRREG